MEYEGDLSLLSKLAEGKWRIGALGLSGGNAGAEGCAQACAFESRGLTQFQVIGAVSSFAGAALYFTAGILNTGASCYWEECSTDSFISFDPIRLIRGTSADVGFLTENVFRKEVSADAVRAFPGDFVVGVTDWETGKGELIDVKTAIPDPFVAVRASMAMPVLYREPVKVNGTRKYDGAVGIPFPAIELIERWELDGLIVFANHPKNWSPQYISRVLEVMSTLGMSRERRHTLLNRVKMYHEGLRRLRLSKTPYLIFWGSGKITAFTRDAKRIETVARNAYVSTLQLFDQTGV
jgi:predicted patatin/cPLA2 family phospholipase